MADQTKLRMDWDFARSLIELELSMKLAHWQQLPYVLCALAHHDDLVVMNVAKTVLKLYDGAPSQPGAKHNQSRRFLDPDWKGLPGKNEEQEPPLRPVVPRFSFI